MRIMFDVEISVLDEYTLLTKSIENANIPCSFLFDFLLRPHFSLFC